MDTTEIVAAIDAEITRLQDAKAMLTGTKANSIERRSGVGNGKRTMSAAGRAHIAAAQKARWAKAKRAEK